MDMRKWPSERRVLDWRYLSPGNPSQTLINIAARIAVINSSLICRFLRAFCSVNPSNLLTSFVNEMWINELWKLLVAFLLRAWPHALCLLCYRRERPERPTSEAVAQKSRPPFSEALHFFFSVRHSDRGAGFLDEGCRTSQTLQGAEDLLPHWCVCGPGRLSFLSVCRTDLQKRLH